MKIELRKLSDIKPYPGNPRLNDAAVDAVAAVDPGSSASASRSSSTSDGVIIVGHTRCKAAQKLGPGQGAGPRGHGPDARADQGLPDRRQQDGRAGRVGLRPAADRAGANCRAWTSTWSCSGFSTRTNWPSCSIPACKDGLTDPDEVPEPPDEAITQPGDLWILGDHRLLCGDSSKPEDVDRLLDGAAIHLVNTDPPYNVKVEPRSNNAIAAGLQFVPGHDASPEARPGPASRRRPSRRSKKLRAKDRPLANDFVTDEEFDRLLARLVRQHGPRAGAGPRRSTSGAATRTAATTRRC